MLDYSVNYENTKPCVLTHQSVNFGKQLRLTQQQQSDNVLEVQGTVSPSNALKYPRKSQTILFRLSDH